MSKNIGDGIINADTLSLYARLERMGIRSPFMVRATNEIADTVIPGMTPAKYFFTKSAPTPNAISLLKLKKCSDLHYAIVIGKEVLAYTFIADGEYQATTKVGTYGDTVVYNMAGRQLTDREWWYSVENYQSFRNGGEIIDD